MVADLVAAKPVLPTAGAANGWLAGLSLALTAVYLGSVIVRPAGDSDLCRGNRRASPDCKVMAARAYLSG